MAAHAVASKAEAEDIKRVEFQARQRMWALEQVRWQRTPFW